MFKKAIKIGAQNQLSGKDKKVIKSKMSEAFNEQCVEKMLAANDKIICSKVSGSKMLIYVGEQYPLIVDGTGKNNYFPSIYVCAAYQPLLKSLIINQGVQAYIFNGANLMWPGVQSYQGLQNFSKDQVIAIRSSKGQIIAIGAMGCSLEQLKKSNDFSGVANYILHYKGDKLWEMGPKTYPQIIVPLPVIQIKKQEQQPKIQQKKQEVKQQQKKPAKKQQKQKQASKAEQKKKQIKKSQSEPQQQQSDDEDDFMNLVHSKKTQTQTKGSKPIKMEQKNNLKQAFVQDENIQNNKKNKKKQPKKVQKKQQSEQEDIQEEKPIQKNNKKKQPKKEEKKPQKSDSQQKEEDVMEQQQIEQKEDKKKKGGKGKGAKNKKDSKQPQKQKNQGSDNNQQEQAPSAINSKLMDQYFKESLLNAIKLTKIQNQLPIDSGRFYMDFMLLARPEGVKLQIKDSTYKKIGKFFEEMAKQKIIEYKHTKDKKIQGAIINKIFWQNQELKNFVPTIKKMNTKESLQQKVQTYSKAKLKLSKTVVCQTVYKPNQVLYNLLFKKKVNYMPDNSEDQVTENQKHQEIFVDEKQIRQKIQKYINTIIENNKEKQKEKQKQKEGKQKKVEKGILVDYKKHPFIANLLKKEIDQYEQNKAREEILKPEDEDDQDKKKKKNKGKQQDLFKIDRPFLAQKIMKNAIPHYHLYDKEAKLDKFKQGTFKGVQIIAQKANNKNITTIIGLQTFITPQQEIDDQINGFANLLQLKFACSVNVQNLPGKNAGKQIIAHGTFLDELVDMFQEQYGLNSKFITTQNKLDKKKKH